MFHVKHDSRPLGGADRVAPPAVEPADARVACPGRPVPRPSRVRAPGSTRAGLAETPLLSRGTAGASAPAGVPAASGRGRALPFTRGRALLFTRRTRRRGGRASSHRVEPLRGRRGLRMEVGVSPSPSHSHSLSPSLSLTPRDAPGHRPIRPTREANDKDDANPCNRARPHGRGLSQASAPPAPPASPRLPVSASPRLCVRTNNPRHAPCAPERTQAGTRTRGSESVHADPVARVPSSRQSRVASSFESLERAASCWAVTLPSTRRATRSRRSRSRTVSGPTRRPL